MTVGQQRYQDALDHSFLADHHGVDLCQEIVQEEHFMLDLGIELPNVCYVHCENLLSLFQSG